MTLAIDVIEDILNFLYALDYKASLLGKLKASQGENLATVQLSTLLKAGPHAIAEAIEEDPSDSDSE